VIDSGQRLLPIESLSRECYRSFTSLPGAELVDADGVFGVVTGIPISFFSGIANTRLPDDGAATLETAMAPFRARNAPFRWWITPETRPATLARKLPELGLRRAYDAVAMSADLTALRLSSALPEGLSVRRARGREEMRPATGILLDVFGRPRTEVEWWLDAWDGCGYDEGSKWTHFLGFAGGRPIATTSVMISGDLAGIYHVATLAEARGRGIASALTAYALRYARDLGAVEALLQASEMAENVYRAVGFRDLCTVTAMDWRPPGDAAHTAG
jgi:GNAT superfamily N-acetyltransferase